MKLTEFYFTPKSIAKGINSIRNMNGLTILGIDGDHKFPPAEFWKKYDAGEFGKPGAK